MPGTATDHPQCEHGDGSIVRTGLWLSQPKIGTQGLVFGTDASGGPGSKDPRTRIVTWSVIAGSWGPEKFVTLGSLSGVEPPGSSVTQGEAKALAQLLRHTEGEGPGGGGFQRRYFTAGVQGAEKQPLSGLVWLLP